jgi:predicted dehydrogenase
VQEKLSGESGNMAINDSTNLKAAVIGIGKMGLLHASLLSVMPNVELVALCDKSALLRKVAKNTLRSVILTDDLGKLVDLNLDIVYVTTPIPSHYNIVRDIYAKNIAKNLFVEKTLTSGRAQSEELYELSRSSAGCTMVGYMKRFSVTFRRARELLSMGAIGDLLSFGAYAYSSDFFDVKRESSITVARGGALEDLGSHVTDLSLWFFGDLHVTSAKMHSIVAAGSIDEVNFEAENTDGLKGEFDVSWVKPGYRMPEFCLSIKGTKGSIVVDDNMLKLMLNNAEPIHLYRQDLGDSVPFLLGETEYYRETAHFLECIRAGGIPQTNFQTAMQVDSLLEGVRCKANE